MKFHDFLSNPRDASRNKHSCRVGSGAFCTQNRIRNRIENRMCKRALRKQSKVGRDFLHASEEETAHKMLKDGTCKTVRRSRAARS